MTLGTKATAPQESYTAL